MDTTPDSTTASPESPDSPDSAVGAAGNTGGADAPAESPAEVTEEAAAGVTADSPTAVPGGRAPSNKQKLLDQEGDAAADYLEELLDIADLDGDIDIFVENGRASVAVLADTEDPTGLQVLVGRDGEVLDALQELTRLAAQAKTGERSRLLLDIAGFREKRRASAAAVAADVIERVRSTGESVELDPMPAYQRKAVHDAVAEAGLRSDSDGVEPNRFVVVHPA